MTILDTIIQRLRVKCPSFEGRVSKARNLANPEPEALPEAWVGLWTGTYEPQQDSLSRHILERQFIVQYACETEFEPGDEDSHEKALGELEGALINWKINTDYWVTKIASDDIVQLNADHAIWQLTAYYLKVTGGS